MSPPTPPGPRRDLLRSLVTGTADVVGAAYLRAFVRHVAESLGAEAAFVADATEDGSARVVAAWSAGDALQEGALLDPAGPPPVLRVDLHAAGGRVIGYLAVEAGGDLDLLEEELTALRAFAARAAAELERRRHEVALRARESEVAASRARVVEAADAERRRIGRDLHDGAQQRLIVVTQAIDLAARAIGTDPDLAAERLAAAREHAVAAGHELRELARGLHPAGLGERGLEGALRSLAVGSPVPLQIEALPDRRLPEPFELTTFFVVSEALANASRHASATEVRVRVKLRSRSLTVEVADDGVGGADPARGSGLRGLADRVGALGGTFEVVSPPGEGTTVRANVPLAPWRDARQPYLEFGHPDDEGEGERAIRAVIEGRKTASLSLAREWDLEGGPPRIGQLLPVRDHTGRKRACVEVTRVAVLPFAHIDAEMLAAAGEPDVDVEAWRASRRAFWDALRGDIAVLLGEPGWRLTDEEPVILVRFRLADG